MDLCGVGAWSGEDILGTVLCRNKGLARKAVGRAAVGVMGAVKGQRTLWQKRALWVRGLVWDFILSGMGSCQRILSRGSYLAGFKGPTIPALVKGRSRRLTEVLLHQSRQRWQYLDQALLGEAQKGSDLRWGSD